MEVVGDTAQNCAEHPMGSCVVCRGPESEGQVGRIVAFSEGVLVQDCREWGPQATEGENIENETEV